MSERGDLDLPIEAESDIVAARSAAREFARALGFRMTDQSRITTAVSELTRNVVKYATEGRGHVRVSRLDGADGRPGIEDLDSAMQDGTSTSGSLGLGLPGARRLMDEMVVETTPGRGTTVTIRKWLR